MRLEQDGEHVQDSQTCVCDNMYMYECFLMHVYNTKTIHNTMQHHNPN